MAGDEKKCREAGCSGYLTKPIDRVQLLQAVAAAMDQNTSRPGNHLAAVQPIESRLPTADPEFCEIIGEFVIQLQGKLGDLKQAVKEHDVRRIREIAHWVKGAGGTAGFDELTEPASALEKAAKEDRADCFQPIVATLLSLGARLQVPVSS
jgi:hypothetical protein